MSSVRVESIEATLDASQRRLVIARHELEKEQVGLMNSVAAAIAENGPTRKLAPFLFAFHGLRLGNSSAVDNPEQAHYQAVVDAFGVGAMNTIFARDELGHSPRGGPFRVHAFSHDVFHKYLPERATDRSLGFSAVEFGVTTRSLGYGKQAFIGKMVIPTRSISDYPRLSLAQLATADVQEVPLTVLEVERSETDVKPRVIRDTSFMFGTELAGWAEDSHPRTYGAELLRIAAAEDRLNEGTYLH